MASSTKVLLTTSRNPTPRIRTFCSDLARIMPGIVRVNRGKMSTDEVAEKALEHEADRVIIVDRWHGGPGKIKLFRIGESGLVSNSPTINIAGIKLQRELGVSKVKPTHSFVLSASQNQTEVLRLADAFSKFFNIPFLSLEEAVKEGPTLMHVVSDRANRISIIFMVEPKHVEVGPRVTVSNLEW